MICETHSCVKPLSGGIIYPRPSFNTMPTLTYKISTASDKQLRGNTHGIKFAPGAEHCPSLLRSIDDRTAIKIMHCARFLPDNLRHFYRENQVLADPKYADYQEQEPFRNATFSQDERE